MSLSYRVALDRLDFAGTVAGLTRERGVTLVNGGTAPLAIGSVTVDPPQFSVGPWPSARWLKTCSSSLPSIR